MTTIEQIEEMIVCEIKETNPFWFGCVIGIGYKNKPERIRCDKSEIINAHGFKPIAKIKYSTKDEPGYLVERYK